MDEPNSTRPNQPAEIKARVGSGSSPQQLHCPSCNGGNPPVAQNCMWCGQSLRNLGTPTAQLNPHPAWDPKPGQQVQPYQSGPHQNTQTVVYNGQSQGSGYTPPTALAPTQPIYPTNSQYPGQQVHYPQYPQQGQYQAYPQYPHPPIVIHNTQTVVIAKHKSVGLAIFLSFLFGPLGMLYSTVWGGIIIFVLNLVLIPTTLGSGIALTWLIGIVWAAVAASRQNAKAVTAYQQTTTYPPTYGP